MVAVLRYFGYFSISLSYFLVKIQQVYQKYAFLGVGIWL
jgi:hypothetical protein